MHLQGGEDPSGVAEDPRTCLLLFLLLASRGRLLLGFAGTFPRAHVGCIPRTGFTAAGLTPTSPSASICPCLNISNHRVPALVNRRLRRTTNHRRQPRDRVRIIKTSGRNEEKGEERSINNNLVRNNHEKKRGPAYFHNPSSEPLKAITTGQLLDRAAEKWPHKTAIISAHENKTLTFLQAKQQAEQLAACLLKLGLRPGDRLALIGVNTIHWYITMMATAKTGIILVMVNPAYKAKEFHYVLTQVKAKAIITDQIFKTQDYPKLLTEVAPGISSAPHGEPINIPELPELSFIIVASEEKLPCNILYGTSTMYIDICNEVKALLPGNQKLAEACSNIDIVVCGGSMCPPQLAKDISKTFPSCKIQFIYGMTEASPICFANKLEDSFEQRTTTVGYLADNLEVKIVDREGRMVDFGMPGEAWFRSYANFIGYWDNETKTKEAKTIDGWLRSGDLMILREDGYGSVVGRIKDVIIRGGENIFPAEIEDFLVQHPEIIDAQVFGVSNDRLGEEVAVAIKLCDSSTMTESSLQEHCKGKISHFKIPKYVRFVKEYPTTLSGKIKKYVLREMLEEELKK
ncbi:unnamed protein product [Nezara viridula]|uniref:Medium-chain acyl-CoA ligase ACSF2, mitochondrial n=1 Tax=Nezara viridula TaxID=85310 RepID=A0A9P0HK67_NEZVI|nr:unnamed protein product [Nezara viridula]